MILFGNTDHGRHFDGEKEWQRGKSRTLTVAKVHPSIYSIHFPKHMYGHGEAGAYLVS